VLADAVAVVLVTLAPPRPGRWCSAQARGLPSLGWSRMQHCQD